MSTVGKLRKAIESLDDSIPLLTSGFDHSLVQCDFEISTARKEGRGYIEDHGEEHTPTAEYGPPIPAVIFE